MPKRLTPRGQAAPPVEPNVADAHIARRPKAPVKPRAPRKVTPKSKYVYNLHHIKTRMTLNSKREIELEPRGQRGDLDIVNEDEQQDPIYLVNQDILFEVIDIERAQDIIARQRFNEAKQPHAAANVLLNEYGKPVEVTGTAELAQNIKVGDVSAAADGRFTEGNVEISRVGPEIVERPGSAPAPKAELTFEAYQEFLKWKADLKGNDSAS